MYPGHDLDFSGQCGIMQSPDNSICYIGFLCAPVEQTLFSKDFNMTKRIRVMTLTFQGHMMAMEKKVLYVSVYIFPFPYIPSDVLFSIPLLTYETATIVLYTVVIAV